MIFSATEKKPFIFVHIPKTGGTSVEEALCHEVFGTGLECLSDEVADKHILPSLGETKQHWKYRDYVKKFGQSLVEDHFSFAFVRNPWDLVVSEISYFRKHELKAFHPTNWDIAIHQICEADIGIWGHDFKPQVSYLCNDEGQEKVDFIGRFDRLSQDYERVCELLGFQNNSLPFLNKSRGGKSHYSEFFSKQTRRLVEQRFASDIARFGFEFESPSRLTVSIQSRDGEVDQRGPSEQKIPPMNDPMDGIQEAFDKFWREQRGHVSVPLAICVAVDAGKYEFQARNLLRSLREFGGNQARCPIVFIQIGKKSLEPGTLEDFEELGAFFYQVEASERWKHYGLSNKVYAASLAESLFSKKVDTLLVLDCDTLVLSDLDELVLPIEKVASGKVVDTEGIGYGEGEEANYFWETLFEICGADKEQGAEWEHVIPSDMSGTIRPYFNSGVVAVRPTGGIFRSMAKLFNESDRLKIVFDSCSDQYRYYLEQCLFAAMVLSKVPRGGFEYLSEKHNYPLHLHHGLPKERKILSFEGVTILHHHAKIDQPNWFNLLKPFPSLLAWLGE